MMLRAARADPARRRYELLAPIHSWHNVQLAETDAEDLSANRLEALAPSHRCPFDAALCTLGMSVIPGWEAAGQAMLAMVRPGGRIAVMDGCYPHDPARPARR